ncbi:hypothetical protein MUBE_05730 [Mycobacterium uberis]|uniref:Uncharacterized protein n=1 Tax=Mycobacterium uberis TaxID=2162698 RepID=A0A3E1HIT0_9MYCO|nr:hypothetical protein [Mycobacterium uberis]RFD26368.1 hypothetical protein MUBE_05730 [Mycobacterium uberis]
MAFSKLDGGNPAGVGFKADVYLFGLEKLAALGVSWVHVSLTGDSVAESLDAIERFRILVMDAV